MLRVQSSHKAWSAPKWFFMSWCSVKEVIKPRALKASIFGGLEEKEVLLNSLEEACQVRLGSECPLDGLGLVGQARHNLGDLLQLLLAVAPSLLYVMWEQAACVFFLRLSIPSA